MLQILVVSEESRDISYELYTSHRQSSVSTLSLHCDIRAARHAAVWRRVQLQGGTTQTTLWHFTHGYDDCFSGECCCTCSLRPQTVASGASPSLRTKADIDYNCLLSKLLFLLLPILNCQLQIPRRVFFRQQLYLNRWKMLKFRPIYLYSQFLNSSWAEILMIHVVRKWGDNSIKILGLA